MELVLSALSIQTPIKTSLLFSFSRFLIQSLFFPYGIRNPPITHFHGRFPPPVRRLRGYWRRPCHRARASRRRPQWPSLERHMPHSFSWPYQEGNTLSVSLSLCLLFFFFLIISLLIFWVWVHFSFLWVLWIEIWSFCFFGRSPCAFPVVCSVFELFVGRILMGSLWFISLEHNLTRTWQKT